MLFAAKSAILFPYTFHSDLDRKQTLERIKALFTMNENLTSTEIKDLITKRYQSREEGADTRSGADSNAES